MPNLSRIIQKATVFHNHYSNGNYTTPGTASLLTGTLPWTHRAFRSYGTVYEDLKNNNIFSLFQLNGYHTLAYTHNPLVERLLIQFIDNIDSHIPRQKLFLVEDINQKIFKNDYDTAELSRHQVFEDDDIYNDTTRYTQTLFLQSAYEKILNKFRRENVKKYSHLFPRGLPKLWGRDSFLLEDGIDFLNNEMGGLPSPFFGYIHFLPPHYPYSPRLEFSKLFNGDGYQMPEKPMHLFSTQYSYKQSLRSKKFYNQHIAYVDSEFARLFDTMEKNGFLDNTVLVFTSDHGEMFERGIIGHRTECLHEPVIKVPMVIFEPGQTKRHDIFYPKSNIDIIPTLLHLTDQTIPVWVEGDVLPPFTSSKNTSDRSIFTVQALYNSQLDPLTEASISMVKGQHKLHAYFGYTEIPSGEILYELYDLKNDPDELDNLISTKPALFKTLKEEMLTKLREVNQPFTGA
jgi:arylsulfatase A-like enzyme